MIVYLTTISSMGDDRWWMYDIIGREVRHTQMSGGIQQKILLSVHSLWRLLKRSGVHASNILMRGVLTRSY
jgi:hypothetical protein